MDECATEFLTRSRLLIQKRWVDPNTQNPKTRKTLDNLGLAPHHMLEEIMNLTEDDLFDGPCPDDNPKYGGIVWIFKKKIEGFIIYIKLKIRNRSAGEDLFVMSFHVDWLVV